MRIAVVGSRNFPDMGSVRFVIRHCIPEFTTLVSGGARGVDSIAMYTAQASRPDLKRVVFPADWRKWGKAAGFLRNRIIVEHSDWVIAFWDGKSPGTANTIRLAKEAGKPVKIIYPNGKTHSLEDRGG